MSDRNGWLARVEASPRHSQWYVDRFRSMAVAVLSFPRFFGGLGGEARFVDAVMPRRSWVLEAGCEPGRVGALLAGAGHEVVRVDLDPVLIEAAERDHPGSRWLVGDLVDLPA